MPGNQIFRKEALEKLSSPEQLDQLITVTDTRGWIAITAIAIIIVTAVLWSIGGDIPVTVSGNGILLREGGRHKVVSLGSGIVTELNINLDDVVKKGDILAFISQPELDFELEKLEKELNNFNSEKNKSENTLESIKYLEFEIQELKEKIELFSKIKSPESGYIVSLMIDKQDFVEKNSVVAIIENPDKELNSVFYVPVATGKNIQPGMKIRISPSTVKSEEFGFIMGTVTFVSHFPTVRERMMGILQNEQLVDDFLKDGAPLEIQVELEKDSSTKSGFKWSSGKGPDNKLTSGTLCTGNIVLKTFHPISLIFPEAGKGK